ncbi:MAG: hypothetical protein GY866_20025 [Proteobacteria bacterium]|nr:hypothetical protein [Pseudomonadota bacterium]
MKTIHILLIILVLVSLGDVFAADSVYRVQGKVAFHDGSPASEIPVVLMKIAMDKQPKITPVQRDRTDKRGAYTFRISSLENNVFYRVNATFQGQMIGSEPVRFKPGQSSLTINLELPEIIVGFEHLTFLKSILVFELMDEAIRVTEIINFENRTNGSVDAKKTPFVKRIPRNAVNFRHVEKRKDFRAVVSPGQVGFELIVPQGKHQLYFSYELPATDRSLSFVDYLPPAVGEIELIVPGESLSVFFDISDGNIRDRVISRSRTHEKTVYYSKILPLEESIEKVGIRIENIPVSQKQLFYPAIILAIILLCGLFWFSSGRLRPLSRNHH